MVLDELLEFVSPIMATEVKTTVSSSLAVAGNFGGGSVRYGALNIDPSTVAGIVKAMASIHNKKVKAAFITVNRGKCKKGGH
jgi:hypothetical protein